MDYILIPHFYRLNWAKQMSMFLSESDRFEFLGPKLEFGTYSKAGKLRDLYLDYLLEKHSQIGDRPLFFVNLNDYIFYKNRKKLKDAFKIFGFMRGSRLFDGEPGNSGFKKSDLMDVQNEEREALASVDKLFIASQAFRNFLVEKNEALKNVDIKVTGLPIFMTPSYLGKSDSQIRDMRRSKIKNLIIWNHRLQKQKNPWVLFELESYIKKNIAICTPEALSAAYSKEMKEHEDIFYSIIRDNGKKRDKYLNILGSAEFVLSTGQHETWGNSMIEGIMNGAAPFAPDGGHCSYKELFPEEFLYPQSLLEKNKNPILRDENMIKLSCAIESFITADHLPELILLQESLWRKFNRETWLNNII
jgi:hypothetical protein